MAAAKLGVRRSRRGRRRCRACGPKPRPMAGPFLHQGALACLDAGASLQALLPLGRHRLSSRLAGMPGMLVGLRLCLRRRGLLGGVSLRAVSALGMGSGLLLGSGLLRGRLLGGEVRCLLLTGGCHQAAATWASRRRRRCTDLLLTGGLGTQPSAGCTRRRRARRLLLQGGLPPAPPRPGRPAAHQAIGWALLLVALLGGGLLGGGLLGSGLLRGETRRLLLHRGLLLGRLGLRSLLLLSRPARRCAAIRPAAIAHRPAAPIAGRPSG